MDRINKEGNGILRVFLSSTFGDLKDERVELLNRIDGSFEAVGMEGFIPTGEHSQKVALDELSRCDVVVFLISSSYGSDIDSCVYKEKCKADYCGMKTGKEKISYTWCEYRFSLAEKKPHMCYIIEDNTWPMKDSAHKLWEFRKEIENEFSPRIERDDKSVQKVVENLISNVVEWYSKKKIGFRNFAGRREEVKELFEKVRKGKCTVVYGVGGVGKTTLCEVILLLYKILCRKVIYIGREEGYSSGTGYEYASKILEPKRYPSLSIDDLIDCLELPREMRKVPTKSKIDNILLKLNNERIILFIDNPEDDESFRELIRKGNNDLVDGSILFSAKKEYKLANYRVGLKAIEYYERGHLVEIMAKRMGKSITKYDVEKIKKIGEGLPVATYLLVSNLEKVETTGLKSFGKGLGFSSDEEVKEYILRVFETSLSKGTYDFVKRVSAITRFEPVDVQILEILDNKKLLDKKVWLEAIDAGIMGNENGKLVWKLNQFQDVIFKYVSDRDYSLALQYYQTKQDIKKKVGDEIKN